MAVKKVQCETIHVRITGGMPLTIPAFTRDVNEFRDKLDEIIEEYLRMAEGNTLPSLGDFSCYLLSRAAADPREQ